MADDQLSSIDQTSLIQNLNTIAANPDWQQASVDAANAIFDTPRYSETAWAGFFSNYFATQPYTDPLANYLIYPTFYWLDPSTNVKLQTALERTLIDEKVVPEWNAAATTGGTFFADNSTLRQDLYNSQNLLTMIGAQGTAGPSLRQTLYNDISALVGQYPSILKSSMTFDPTTQPYFGALRAQTWLTLLGSAPSSDPARAVLTSAVKGQVASTLGLQGNYAQLWNDFTVLYLDNNGSNAQQRSTLHNLLAAIPSQLHNTASITVDDYLGNTTAYQSQSLALTRPYGGYNLFGINVGDISENEFPADVSPGLTDVFMIVAAHETNHGVDAVSVVGNPILNQRRQELLAAAGNDHLNFLRSMFDDGFFQANPQEFIASISNQWFADSTKTIQLGLSRFDAGRPQPLNQALFFAEIYSQGLPSAWFYTIDTAGNITRQLVPLKRDDLGHIDELTFNNQHFHFALDAEGNVTGYQVEAVIPGDYNGDGIVDAADYTVWRDTLGSTMNLAADGNGNGIIDAGDYSVWKNNFGNHSGSGASANAAVPEPATLWMLLAGILTICCRRRAAASKTH